MKSFSLVLILWYVFPVILLVASNFIVRLFDLNERFGWKPVDVATPFLFIGLNYLSKDAYGTSVVPYVFITIFLFAIVLAGGHGYFYGEIQYSRFLKTLWRVVFLYTIILYGLFIILNILSHF